MENGETGEGMKADRRIWKAVQQEIASRITEHQYQTWFKSVDFDFTGPEHISISVPNRFYQTFLKHRYLPVILESIETVMNLQRPRIEFQIEPSADLDDEEPRPQDDLTPVIPTPVMDTFPANLPLNPGYTFEQFITGPSNRLAHAAAIAIADHPGTSYNPLFIYGNVGLGKTHLMQAVAHTYCARRHGRVVYLSCASFTNDFISAVGNSSLDAFRKKYRDADALLIDDIQFLASKERTQEEFFHTFNAVYNEQKQIFLSSDSLPNDIGGLGDRLVSRFKLGLVAALAPPTFETRCAILVRKADNLGLQIPIDVAEYVAHQICDNIREIEGAVLRLHTLVAIEKKPITLDAVKESLADLFGDESTRIDLLKIQQSVLEEFEVLPADLHSRKRTRSIVVPRQICMYVARRHTDLSLGEIGAFFGGRDHSTVLHGIEKVVSMLDKEPRIRRAVDSIERHLRR